VPLSSKEKRFRISGNNILRILETYREEVIGGWREMHNEEFNNLYFSLYIITVIKT
jgi:hypothetical protein